MTSRPAPASTSELFLYLVPTTRAARDVLALMGETGTFSDAEARDLGAARLGQLLNGQRYAIYLRNNGQGTGGTSNRGENGEIVVEMRLATDVGTDAASAVNTVANQKLIQQLEGRTLLFVGTSTEDNNTGQSQFLLFSVRAAPEPRGFKDAWSFPARAVFDVGDDPNPQRKYGFSPRLLTAIRRLPEPRAQRESIQKRLTEWNGYLGVLERTAKARQFIVAYTSLKRSANNRQITLTLTGDVPWDKVRNALEETLEIVERPMPKTPNGEMEIGEEDDAYPLGALSDIFSDRNEIRLSLDEESVELFERRNWNLPKAAHICYRASGDLAQIRRYKAGLDSLEQGHAENPRLSEFLFDATQARLPEKGQRLAREQLLLPTLNAGQLAAVEAALNAPDLCLIQGPPGTGKTTVIAEICYQNALRGQRTLLASQANLAVDHALSKLVHHPSLRVLRRGRADRVEIEGAPFLEENVVATWLSKTASGCEDDLALRRQRIEQFEQLLEHRTALEQLAAYVAGYQGEHPQLVERAQNLERLLAAASQRAAQLARALEERRNILANPEQNLRAFGDHPRLEQYREDVRELERAIAAWTGEARPGSRARAVAQQNIFDRAAAAVRVQGLIVAQTDTIRQRLGYVEQAARAWYSADAQLTALSGEIIHLQRTTVSQQDRLQSLISNHQSLEADLAAFSSLPSRLPTMRPALEHWLENLTQRIDLTPLPEFTGRLGQLLWNEACTAAHIYKLAAQAKELQTARVESARFAQLINQFNASANTLAEETLPEILERAGRRRVHWAASPLNTLVARDSHGGLHPALGLNASWRAITEQLRQLRQRPTGWRSWLPDERRQLEVARWILWLRAAADDLAQRQSELRNLSESYALRLPEKLPAFTDALQAALLQIAAALEPQYQQELATLAAHIRETQNTLATLQSQTADALIRQQALQGHQADLVQRIVLDAETLSAATDADEDTDPTKLLQPIPRFAFDVSPLTQKMGAVSAEAWLAEWQGVVADFDQSREQLVERAARLEPTKVLEALLADAAPELQRLETNAAKAAQTRDAYQADHTAARESLAQAENEYTQTLEWWHRWHATIPPHALPPRTGSADDSDYIAAVAATSGGWAEALAQAQADLARREAFVSDWVKRLRGADAQDSADLRQIYIDNANVIGITCAQAGAYRFSREYRNFDCVIIDEVSKATPPELLLPMLKGRRVVLVGDHKQLPPMLGPDTLTDLAEDLGVAREDLAHLERALFQELFEQAPDPLRILLTEQYRMHPQIMAAINQFYAEQLVCGLPDPDAQRAHGLNLAAIKPEHHLVWIGTPNEEPYFEQRVGTTFRNPSEIDVIERLVRELDEGWGAVATNTSPKAPPKEVGVITFYSAQLRELRDRLLLRNNFKHLRLRIGTVDRFQGMERPIIIASLVRNNAQGNVGFAQKPERVNVAFSRAQELLVIVGCRDLFTLKAKDQAATAIYGRVADMVKQAGGLRRVAGK